MNWIVWLGLAVVIVAIAAVSGIRPRGGRPVAGSHLMNAARVALVVVVVIFVYMAYRAHVGG